MRVKAESIISEYKNLLNTLVSNTRQLFNDNLHHSLSKKGGVYRIFEYGSTWQNSVYVGQAINLHNRIYRNHFLGSKRVSTLKRKLIKTGRFKNEKTVKRYFKTNCFVQYIVIEGKPLRNSFEHFAISILKPQYNDKVIITTDSQTKQSLKLKLFEKHPEISKKIKKIVLDHIKNKKRVSFRIARIIGNTPMDGAKIVFPNQAGYNVHLIRELYTELYLEYLDGESCPDGEKFMSKHEKEEEKILAFLNEINPEGREEV